MNGNIKVNQNIMPHVPDVCIVLRSRRIIKMITEKEYRRRKKEEKQLRIDKLSKKLKEDLKKLKKQVRKTEGK